ncbi:unnamed protein product, partial [marine sediment metagenome]
MFLFDKNDQVCKNWLMAKTFLSTTEVAELLGVTSQTVRNWIKDGLIKAYRLNPTGSILVK